MTFITRILLALALCIGLPVKAAESTGTPVTATFLSSTAEIFNQERGWYSWIGSQYCSGASAGSIASARAAGYSMVLCIMDLSADRTNATINATTIAQTQAMFDLVRAGHVKVIIRAAYNYDNNSGGGLDASQANTLAHIAQLKDLFRKNADVIAYAQAGFIGPYGEWWSGGGTGAIVRTATQKAQIRDAILASFHPRTQVGFRYVSDVIAFYPSGLTNSIFSSGAAQSRVATHQDCLLADDTDGGTYNSLTDTKRDRSKSDSNYISFGGETCNYTQTTSRKTCADALGLGAYHLTYLNRSYDTAYYNAWTTGGCYAQFTRSMGYRFRLMSVTHQSTATVGQTLTFDVPMLNEGWSRIFSERRLQVRLYSGSTQVVSAMSPVDLRKLPPQATSPTLIRVPGLVAPAAGTYFVYLCSPDVWATLQNDPLYSLRFANTDNTDQAWDSVKACWKTGTTVVTSN